ncbi:MAG: glycosyltransferase, partial [Actinomycetota bacterium]|nr:glycosyltransferase [Actinomycetota bacterium]
MAVRVLLVSKGLGPGGAEHLLVELARRIIGEQQVSDPSQVELTAAYVLPWKDHLAGALEEQGVEAICLSRRRRDPAWILRLRRLVASGRFDVVHVHSPVPAAVARLAARATPSVSRPRLVSTEHNTWTSHRLATRLANRVTSGLDDVTIAVTDEVRRSMRGRARDRARVVVHGIDVARVGALRGERVAVRAELGINARPVVGTVANFRRQKDYPNLLHALRLLVDRGIDLHVVAVGQGPLEREVRELSSSLGLDGTVTLTGFRADAARVMAGCDVFVLASAWEGLPVAVMEAMALGLPIVATRVGGLAETLDDVALLVASGDSPALAAALSSVLVDDQLRLSLTAASSRRAGDFDIARAAGEITACYEVLVPAPSDDGAVEQPPPTVRRRTGSPHGMSVRPLAADDVPAVIGLLGASLGWGNDERYDDLYRWKHERNPFGRSFGWVATADDGAVAAVRLFMRWEFRRGQEVLRAVRAVDTATRPDAQG